MMATLKVMTYFKISLSTHNWDRAFFIRKAPFGLLSGGMTTLPWQGEGDMTHGMIRIVR